MDDLDRLAFRLVRTARASYPHLLSHGFSLSDVEERLLPFREARREMAESGADSWERTVLRLLSGERDYVVAETGMQSACRQALQHPSPSLSLVRQWASTTLMLGRGAASIAGAAGATEAAVASAVSSAKASISIQHNGRDQVSHMRALPSRGCRYCGGRLPDGRVLTFCPHCGLDLTKRQCPACSTEMEMSWRFCVTCGRGAEGTPEKQAIASMAVGAAAG